MQQHHTDHLPLLLRTECIFLEEDAVVERIVGGWLMRSPRHPGDWWGNALFMDQAPDASDVTAWPKAFRRLLHSRQPESRHMTFGWEGDNAGAAPDFVSMGFNFFSVSLLSAIHVKEAPLPAPLGVQMRAFAPSDWPLLVDLMIDQGDQGILEPSYLEFARLRVAHWQQLASRDQGDWFGAFHGKSLVGALGIYVESQPDRTGRRLARFQQVLTARPFQGRGIASSLLSLAARQIALRHAPSEFVIQALTDGKASRLYRKMGFTQIGRAFGLELAPVTSPGSA